MEVQKTINSLETIPDNKDLVKNKLKFKIKKKKKERNYNQKTNNYH